MAAPWEGCWLPQPPPLSRDDLDYWHEWARGQRIICDEITRAAAWKPARACSTCRLLGEQVPAEGCRRHHPYIDWLPNRWQPRLWWARSEFVASTAGTRSGKSSCGAAMLTWYANPSGTLPRWFLDESRVPLLVLLPWLRNPNPGPRTIWIGGPRRDNLERGIVGYVRQYLDGTPWLTGVDEYIAQGGLRSTRVIRIEDESEIEVKVQDQGIAAFMSAQIDVFWEDEEFEGETGDDLRREARNRLSDRLGRYFFNATAINTALRGGQSELGKKILAPGRRGELDPRKYLVMQASTLDNLHMTDEARAKHDEDNRDPVTGEITDWWRVRVAGEAIGVNLLSVLPQRAIEWMMKRATAPLLRGSLTDEQRWKQRGRWENVPGWVPRPAEALHPTFEAGTGGPLYIWEQPQPEHDYVIGADAGHGMEGTGNPAAAWVFCRTTGRFVAVYHGIIGAIDFAAALARLGWYYNHAWLCVALGAPGFETVGYLAGANADGPRYNRLYRHSPGGTWEDIQDKRPGFPDHIASERNSMLSQLADVLRPATLGKPETIPIAIPDIATLREMASVQRDAKSLLIVFPSGEEGLYVTHCDRVVAAALCIVAHRSPACPMVIREKTRERHPDPSTELSIQAIERDLERQRRDDEARSGSTRVRSSHLRRVATLRR